MDICRVCAGFSMGEADNVRRAMSKKKQHVIDEYREVFVNGDEKKGVAGCVANGISETIANTIYDKMVSFAKYAFNKAHAAAYALTAFMTAYLKYYYTGFFFAVCMNYAANIDERRAIVGDIKEMGYSILPPDINKSERDFTVANVNGKWIPVYGLSQVKSVGKAADFIMEERNANGDFTSIKDFLLRCFKAPINKRVFTALVDAGAFDSLCPARSILVSEDSMVNDIMTRITDKRKQEVLIENATKVLEFVENYATVAGLKERIREEGISYQVTSKNVPKKEAIEKKINNAKEKINSIMEEIDFFDLDEFLDIALCTEDRETTLERERAVLGLYLTGHPTEEYSFFSTPISDVDDEVSIINGVVLDFEEKVNKRGEKYATFSLEDQTGSIKCNMYASDYTALPKNFLRNGVIIQASGRVKVDTFNSTEEEKIYCMDVKSCSVPKITGEKKYRIEVDNVIEYIYLHDKIAVYNDDNGYPLYILAKDSGLEYNYGSLVSSNVKNVGAVLV